MDLSVVICTYNRASSLAVTLEALLMQEAAPSLRWEVVVVDNNSRDHTREVVESFAARNEIRVVYTFEPNQGQSHARNTGVKVAHGDVIAFTDDDVIPERNWLAHLVAVFAKSNADGVGGRILPKWEAPVPAWLTKGRQLWWCLALLDTEKEDFLVWPEVKGGTQIWGANMAFRRSVFSEVGYFNIDLGHVQDKLFRGEESELIRRALQRKKRLFYDPSLTVYHRISASRMTKKFFRKVALDAGEAHADPALLDCSVAIFGAPRWLYRKIATEGCRWIAHRLLCKDDAFSRQIELCGSIGRLKGFWSLRRKMDAVTQTSVLQDK